MNQREQKPVVEETRPPIPLHFLVSLSKGRKHCFSYLIWREGEEEGGENGGEAIRSSSVRRRFGACEEEVRRLLWSFRQNVGRRRWKMGRIQSCSWRVSRWGWNKWLQWICHHRKLQRCSRRWTLDLSPHRSLEETRFLEEEGSWHLLWTSGERCSDPLSKIDINFHLQIWFVLVLIYIFISLWLLMFLRSPLSEETECICLWICQISLSGKERRRKLFYVLLNMKNSRKGRFGWCVFKLYFRIVFNFVFFI